jgi:neurotransmitter:Na+ symporter, NSS family
LLAGSIVFVLGIPCALSGSNSLFGNWSIIYGKTYFETVDFFVNSWLLPIIGLSTSILIGWKMSRKEVRDQFRTGSVFGFLFRGWYFFIRWVVPVAILVILLQGGGVIDVDKIFHRSNNTISTK